MMRITCYLCGMSVWLHVFFHNIHIISTYKQICIVSIPILYEKKIYGSKFGVKTLIN